MVAFQDTNVAFNPNARYDCGPSAAGCGRLSDQSTLNLPPLGTSNGLQPDGRIFCANLLVGQNAAGAVRTGNVGPNTAGAPRNWNEANPPTINLFPPV